MRSGHGWYPGPCISVQIQMYQANVVSERELQAYRPHDQRAVKGLPTEPFQSSPYALSLLCINQG